MGIFKKWYYRLTSPKVPVIRFANMAHTLEYMECRKRENSLIDPWNQRGYEIRSNPIEIIKDGKKQLGYAVDEAGISVDLKRDIRVQPALPPPSDMNNPTSLFEVDTLLIPKQGTISYSWEGIIGKLATLDDLNEALDIGRSLKNTVIGILVGIPVGWILTAAMK